MKRVESETDIYALQRDAQLFAVIAAWEHVGAWAALERGTWLSCEEIPGNTRALEITAPILAHVGLLMADGSRWALSDTARTLRSQGLLDLRSAEAALGDLSRLDVVLAEGGPARGLDGESRVTEGGVREENRGHSRTFLEMLWRRSEVASRLVAQCLKEHAPGGGHILDLGGGHGRYAAALADEGFRVTLSDRPLCVDLTEERYGDHLDYLRGDFMTDEIGGPYDVVLMSNIVHGLSPEENRHLLARVVDALAPGGMVLVKDLFMDEGKVWSEEGILFGLVMLMYTREGRSYTLGEMRALARDVGLSLRVQTLVPDQRFSLLLFAR